METGTEHRIRDVLCAIESIQGFVYGMSVEEFEADFRTQCAVQHQFLVMGEAVRYIDPQLLEKYSYPWHIPRSFRNFIIHEYHKVKVSRIYYAALDLSTLEQVAKQILKDL